MKMQKVFHKEEEDELSFVSENCHYCKEELIKVDDILVDEEDHYCCQDCNAYHRLNAKECKDI